MKISKKSDYALRALMTLAADAHTDTLHTIRDLAQINDIPKRFLEHIMLDMKNEGWVKGIAGRDGGYQLNIPPSRLTMARVIRLFDGTLSPINCVSSTEYEKCSQESTCRFRRLFLEIRNMSTEMMEQATLSHLLNKKPVTISEVEEELIYGAGI
ncbi:RrF2 family transcriptional regulator [Chitinivibrio alkaliphilus]|uniref:Transcriptional regulator, Rrf2 family n=1 Tax=Chitinivibrio alkaliphilus ACht1 TaxID=1313304 RepID=U7D904_9BACT|nr:Rrf2 family transcriptional regulator [Chitinivibrio alkaliphilus]ERP30875.1 transcriptional regulator, Rrf2 family [Chitinivibrio alkaliphilus ACht1]